LAVGALSAGLPGKPHLVIAIGRRWADCRQLRALFHGAGCDDAHEIGPVVARALCRCPANGDNCVCTKVTGRLAGDEQSELIWSGHGAEQPAQRRCCPARFSNAVWRTRNTAASSAPASPRNTALAAQHSARPGETTLRRLRRHCIYAGEAGWTGAARCWQAGQWHVYGVMCGGASGVMWSDPQLGAPRRSCCFECSAAPLAALLPCAAALLLLGPC
jgi:hypothetical protein